MPTPCTCVSNLTSPSRDWVKRGDVRALTSVTTAWCASQHGNGSPMVTTVDGKTDAIVWSVGAEDDDRLHDFDGDTGAEVFASDTLGPIARFATPIAAAGRIVVAGASAVYAFRP